MTTQIELSQSDNWQACVQAMHAHIRDTANDQCLLWVNPAQTDVFADNQWVQENRVQVPIAHPRFDVKFAPYLVGLDLSKSTGSDLLEQSVQVAYRAWELPSLQAYSGQPIAGWVRTNSTASALASHWASFAYVHLVNGLTKLLRFHDPSVREWLWSSLTSRQQALLLGPAIELIGISRQQRVMQHQLAAPVQATDNKQLRLTEDQWLQVDDYATLHEAWLLQSSQSAGAENECAWRNSLPANWHQSLLKALQSATQYGIESSEDRVLFARHALQMGPQFHAHSLLKDVWPRTKNGDFYGGALEEVTGHPAHTLAAHLLAHS